MDINRIAVKADGVIAPSCLDFSGWRYRVQVDHRGIPWTIEHGAVLCLIWPTNVIPPIPVRLAYLKPEMLDQISARS